MILNNKTAIITGASSGLGAAVASALIAKNTKVYGVARNKEALDKLQTNLGPLFQPVVMDITDKEKLEDWIESTFCKDQLPDILINNAGTGSFKKIEEMPTEEWLTMVNTNLNGMYFITAKLIPLFKQNEASTHIINIGSILGTTARSEGTAYCTTKYGVRGFSQALYRELRSDNIKVTCVQPGSIDTSFFESSGIDAHSNMLQPADIANMLVHILETPDNMLIDEITLRPLDARKPR